MPYFHVTFATHIASIQRHGLGGAFTMQNFPGCEPGVYLATDHKIGLVIMISAFFEHAPDSAKPREWIESLRVIVIDDSRIDPKCLREDSSFPGDANIRRYTGVIDIRSMPVLTIDDVTPKQYQPGGAEYDRILSVIS